MYQYRRGFIKILQRYMDRQSSPDEKRAMDYWYEAIDEPDQEEKSATDRQRLENKLWSRIQTTIHEQPEPVETAVTGWFSRNVRKMAVAAIVVLMSGLVYWFSGIRDDVPSVLSMLSAKERAALTSVVNETRHSKRIRLADGSQVELEPNATLYYPQPFGPDKRVVYLMGNGYFLVSHNPEKPFFVYCEQLVTKVLGTSFTIRKNELSGAIEVAVRTGKVQVEKVGSPANTVENKPQRVVIFPNEKVTFQQQTGTYQTGLVDNPRVVDSTDEFRKADAFIFENTRLTDVLEKLEKAYGVDIKLTNTAIGDCPVTANLADDSLFARLEIINALLNTRTEVQGTIIVMTGGECAPYKSAN